MIIIFIKLNKMILFQSPADRVLIYLTLYISECLKKLQRVNKVITLTIDEIISNYSVIKMKVSSVCCVVTLNFHLSYFSVSPKMMVKRKCRH